jgi:hypothetical protein
LDGWPGQRSRELLLPIDPWSVNHVVQANWNGSVGSQKAQKVPQDGNGFLQGQRRFYATD